MVYFNSIVTLFCSALSLIGSIIIILSYEIAKTKSRPKAAILIRNLAFTDFMWFLSSLIESVIWVSSNSVPDYLCYILSPTVNFFRMASLVWTCAISFDVYMSYKMRRWQLENNENQNTKQQVIFYSILFGLSSPGAILNIIKQHANGDKSLGCSPGYEKIGSWIEIVFTQLIPILLGFAFNVFVCFNVYQKLALKAYPNSVRKRRRRVMYHYIIVCLFCWAPTIIFYVFEITGGQSILFEVVARATLYLTGFFNFLVFGMQDPHLKRSASFIFGVFNAPCNKRRPSLITRDVQKTVMFEETTITKNADISRDKRRIYRYKRLSETDKNKLYEVRPDLNPNAPLGLDCEITNPLVDADKNCYLNKVCNDNIKHETKVEITSDTAKDSISKSSLFRLSERNFTDSIDYDSSDDELDDEDNELMDMISRFNV